MRDQTLLQVRQAPPGLTQAGLAGHCLGIQMCWALLATLHLFGQEVEESPE